MKESEVVDAVLDKAPWLEESIKGKTLFHIVSITIEALGLKTSPNGEIKVAPDLTPEDVSDLRWVRGFVLTRSEPNTKRLDQTLALIDRIIASADED